jgi:hypothetical protein
MYTAPRPIGSTRWNPSVELCPCSVAGAILTRWYHRAADGVMRDLQRTCAVCREKGVCEWDLRDRPDDPVWKGYCHNAVTLESLMNLKV